MTEKSPAQKIDEGERAKRYLEDAFLGEILTEMREGAIRQVMHTPDRRQEAIGVLLAIESLHDALQSRVTTGRIAAEKGA